MFLLLFFFPFCDIYYLFCFAEEYFCAPYRDVLSQIHLIVQCNYAEVFAVYYLL